MDSSPLARFMRHQHSGGAALPAAGDDVSAQLVKIASALRTEASLLAANTTSPPPAVSLLNKILTNKTASAATAETTPAEAPASTSFSDVNLRSILNDIFAGGASESASLARSGDSTISTETAAGQPEKTAGAKLAQLLGGTK